MDQFKLVTAHRMSGGSWLLDGEVFEDFDALPSFARYRLSVLIIAPSDFSVNNLGRRVDDDHFWLYTTNEEAAWG